MKSKLVLLSLFMALAAFSNLAHAYLDPGTGSMIISAVIGVLATVVLAVKTYWYKLVGWFRRKSPASQHQDN